MMLVAKPGLQLALMPFRGLAASYRPANFKHFELRVIQTRRLVVPRPTMCRTQSLRFGPPSEDGSVSPTPCEKRRVSWASCPLAVSLVSDIVLHASQGLVRISDEVRQCDRPQRNICAVLGNRLVLSLVCTETVYHRNWNDISRFRSVR